MELETVDSTAIERAVAEQTDAPTDGEITHLDVRELGPPEPLRETLERVEALSEVDVLLQYNDRIPQFLFPRLDDRGFAHVGIETDDIDDIDETDAVVTAIWRDEVDDGDAAGASDAASEETSIP
ncbi:DUF2249 domain-containing protein [Halorubrum laminariae]|uniref:DUF2249 domain-containing protein n=1 Tax=Halorubrum laminariae TaxID=1433523 RepID=A0ABD6C3C5_9EURY|nr:DUF2249 domain-containing protein [Halorubrum laminariae]